MIILVSNTYGSYTDYNQKEGGFTKERKEKTREP